ncbi:hypothetical protein [Mannheimia haemolytica]|nr:hypothetical protein [Mannheimia haemolytica]
MNPYFLGAVIGSALLVTVFVVSVTWVNREFLFEKSEKSDSK